ncbi:MAG: tetratricopeptide repeat protein [Bacteriovoracaceae bacterium]
MEKPYIQISKQFNAKNFNTDFLKFLSLGNKRLITDMLWIQSLLEADLEQYNKSDLNNWLFVRFNTIFELDPKFLEAYQFAGQYLSIVKDDDLGAKTIFDKGLKLYPNDFSLNWHAGYHYYYELGDPNRAYELFSKIMYDPRAPKYLPSIVAKLKSNMGDKETALVIMQNTLLKVDQKNSILIKKLTDGVISLKIELDLECLNSNKANCQLYRPEGYQYIFKKNKYTTNKPYIPFKLFSRSNK